MIRSPGELTQCLWRNGARLVKCGGEIAVAPDLSDAARRFLNFATASGFL
jgi:hypothetical protein